MKPICYSNTSFKAFLKPSSTSNTVASWLLKPTCTLKTMASEFYVANIKTQWLQRFMKPILKYSSSTDL